MILNKKRYRYLSDTIYAWVCDPCFTPIHNDYKYKEYRQSHPDTVYPVFALSWKKLTDSLQYRVELISIIDETYIFIVPIPGRTFNCMLHCYPLMLHETWLTSHIEIDNKGKMVILMMLDSNCIRQMFSGWNLPCRLRRNNCYPLPRYCLSTPPPYRITYNPIPLKRALIVHRITSLAIKRKVSGSILVPRDLPWLYLPIIRNTLTNHQYFKLRQLS